MSKIVVSRKNVLTNINPALANQWHPRKNGDLTPDMVTVGSQKIVWWLCEKGHEWQASIIATIRYKRCLGCPYCSNNRVCNDNSLSTINPELAKQWHPNKNEDLTPDMIIYGSTKNIWWLCEKGHEWQSSVASRHSKSLGCPHCSNHRVCKDNSLFTINPELSKQWHPAKNGYLTPDMVVYGSNKNIWWICKKGHEWQARVVERNRGIGCAKCNLGRSSSFIEQTLYYYLSKVFKCINKYKHKNLYEIDVFIPELNLGIEYDSYYFHKNSIERDSIKSNFITNDNIRLIRIRESGLPDINKNINLIIFEEKKPEEIVNSLFEYILRNYILSENLENKILKLNIDIDKNRTNIYETLAVNQKNKSLLELNPNLSKEWNFIKNKPLEPSMVTLVSGKKVWWKCKRGHEWQTTISKRTSAGQGCPYCSNKKVCKDNNLSTFKPEIAKQWHPTKNGDLTPDIITAGSDKVVWWICDKYHEWEAKVYARVQGNKCPYCSNRRAYKDNSLATLNTELAKSWHTTKNGILTPDMVTAGSDKVVWWLCDNGHEWQARVYKRNSGRGCPYCSNKKVCKDNSLSTLEPELSKQWHPNKNGDLTADMVTVGSEKKVWWLCYNGHEWESSIYARKKVNKCPYCKKSG